jgi:hypothetical protein
MRCKILAAHFLYVKPVEVLYQHRYRVFQVSFQRLQE